MEPLQIGSAIRVTDATGKEILQQNASSISELDLGFLPIGLYLLQVDSPNGSKHTLIQKIND